MRLNLDENLGRRWTGQLRTAGHDVDTVHNEGLSGAADGDVLAAASQANRVLVTLDLDFASPVRFPPAATPGIAVLRVRERPGRLDLDAVVSRLITGSPARTSRVGCGSWSVIESASTRILANERLPAVASRGAVRASDFRVRITRRAASSIAGSMALATRPITTSFQTDRPEHSRHSALAERSIRRDR